MLTPLTDIPVVNREIIACLFLICINLQAIVPEGFISGEILGKLSFANAYELQQKLQQLLLEAQKQMQENLAKARDSETG